VDVYTRAVSATKREANNRVMEMVFEAGRKVLSAPSSAPSKEILDFATYHKTFIFLAGTTGLEPATSAFALIEEPEIRESRIDSGIGDSVYPW